jgi:Fur family iron response transcriptional regulator
MLIDIPRVAIDLLQLPEPPQGKYVAGVEVIVRLRDEV